VHGSERARLRALPVFLSGAFLLLGAADPRAQPQPTAAFIDTLLRQTLRFSKADLEAIDEGRAVIKSLDTEVRQELAHIGAVYVSVPAAQFIERFRDIERFERGPGIPQIGRFGDLPRINDLASLRLPADDIDALRRCRPGSCDMKLSAQAMKLFSSEVMWTSPDATRQATEVMREVILELVRRYQSVGDTGLGQYDDGEPLSVAEQFGALLSNTELLPVPVPALLTYLEEYPRSRPAGAEDIFYWTVVEFGLQPTIRANHTVIYPLPDRPSGVAYAIATRQLYASHYFHTTLELRFLVEDARPGRRGFHLISITRSRTDGMTGFRGAFLRPIVNRRSRNGVRVYLEHLKRQVESPAPAPSP
jgi:hypothetical protein